MNKEENNKPVLVIGGVSLTSLPSVIIEKFKTFDDRIVEPNEVRDFKVIDDDTCNVAELKIKSIIALENEIEDARVSFKDPLNYLGKGIQAQAKKRSDKCADSKELLSKQVTTYKNLKVAQLAAAETARKTELLELVKEKTAIVERIGRICYQLKAILFGGQSVSSQGEGKMLPVPETIQDLDKIEKIVENSFPDFDEFENFKDDIKSIYMEFKEDLTYYKEHLDDPKWINVLRIKYDKLYEKYDEMIEKVKVKEEKNVEKTIQKEIKEAGKGIREWIKFSVTNQALVPERYKEVINAKVNEYIRENKEAISELIKEGKGDEIIPGLDIRIEKTHVTN